MPSRRGFIKSSLLTGAGLVLTPALGRSIPGCRFKRNIVILHTNDFHSHIDPFPENHPIWAGQGGISQIKTLIDEVRNENFHVLLLDSGDMFQGTPYFNLFGGVPELEWMNLAGYHASTLGNHEFDNGVEKLAEVIKHANFPILNCNYVVDGTALEGKIHQFEVLEIAGKRIGITGVGIDLNNLVSENLCKGIVYQDPVKSVQNTTDILRKKEDCDMVIVLSHLGFEYSGDKIDDKKLAARTKGIDLILGGHTHTFLDKPVIAKNLSHKTTVINQVGWAGLRLGKLVWEL